MPNSSKNAEKAVASEQPKRPGRPSLEKSQELTDLILAEARRLFLQHGFSKTNLDKIVTALHLSKRTIYSRFPSKLELFLAVSEQVMEEHLAGLRDIDFSGESPREQLLHFAIELGKCLSKPELISLERAIMAEAHSFSELTKQVHVCIAPFTIRIAADILAELNPVHSNTSDRILEDAEIFISMVALQLLRQKALYIDDPHFTERDEEMVRRRVNIFLNGYNSKGV